MKPGTLVQHALGGLGVVEAVPQGNLVPVRALRCVEVERPQRSGVREPQATLWAAERWLEGETSRIQGEHLAPETPPSVREALTVMALRVGRRHR